jgi:hypothetical protein
MALFDPTNASLQLLLGARQKKKEEVREEERLAMEKRQNVFGNLTGALQTAGSLAKAGFDVYDTLKLAPKREEAAHQNALELVQKEHENRSAEAASERVWTSEEKRLDRAQEWGLTAFKESKLDSRLQTEFWNDINAMREKGAIDLAYLKEKYGYDESLQGQAQAHETAMQDDRQEWEAEERKLDRVQEWGLTSFKENKLDSRMASQLLNDIALMREKGGIDSELLTTKYGFDLSLLDDTQAHEVAMQDDAQSFTEEQAQLDRIQEWGLSSFKESKLDSRMTQQLLNDIALMKEKGVVDTELLMTKYGFDESLLNNSQAHDLEMQGNDQANALALQDDKQEFEGSQHETELAFTKEQNQLDRDQEMALERFRQSSQDSRMEKEFLHDLDVMREQGAIDFAALDKKYGLDLALEESRQGFEAQEGDKDRQNRITVAGIDQAGQKAITTMRGEQDTQGAIDSVYSSPSTAYTTAIDSASATLAATSGKANPTPALINEEASKFLFMDYSGFTSSGKTDLAENAKRAFEMINGPGSLERYSLTPPATTATKNTLGETNLGILGGNANAAPPPAPYASWEEYMNDLALGRVRQPDASKADSRGVKSLTGGAR